MRLFTRVFNDMRSLTDFANQQGIEKDSIVGIFQAKDGSFTLAYYAEDQQ